MSKKSITKRSEDYSKWYLDIVDQAELAENSKVRGSMVIKPHGYAIWERFQAILDKMFKDTGHKNAYFPLLIPKSFFSREASHVDGFAKEAAVVTHYKLKATKDGKGVEVDPEAKLEEELIIRPTSETIINDTFRGWIESHRDLPLLINQWANVLRWEMRTRPFLRTAEFLWQEGHTAHATQEEAKKEALQMLEIYRKFAEDCMAMPVHVGMKTANERFAGAEETYTIEALMQDGKALQSGTSHELGQNFAKAFDIQFTDKDGERKHVWQTSWGVSTRLIGGLIMAHSDDSGLVLPPKIAPIHVVIVPIWKTDEEQKNVLKEARAIADSITTDELKVHLDDRDNLSAGEKFFEWEKKGVPLRIEIGPKDIEKKSVVLVRRDTGEKDDVKIAELKDLDKQLEQIQKDMYNKAKKSMDEHTFEVDDYDGFKDQLEDNPGFILAHWCGETACEKKIAEETKASIRLIPFDSEVEEGTCIRCGKPSNRRVLFAKAY